MHLTPENFVLTPEKAKPLIDENTIGETPSLFGRLAALENFKLCRRAVLTGNCRRCGDPWLDVQRRI